MSCNWFSGLPTPWGDLTCSAPPLVLHTVDVLAIICAAAVLGWMFYRFWQGRETDEPKPLYRLLPLAMGGVAALLVVQFLAVAAGGPVLVPGGNQQERHIVIVLDASGSTMRAGKAKREQRLREIASQFKHLLKADKTELKSWTASVLRFGKTVETVMKRAPLASVLATIDNEASIETSDPHASAPLPALRSALSLIETIGKPGLILLISDGNWTEDSKDLDALLKRAGVPVITAPLWSDHPLSGITEAYLPHSVGAGEEAIARLVVSMNAEETVTIARNRSDETGKRRQEQRKLLPPKTPVRIYERFSGRGIHYLNVTARMANGGDRRRLYTTVTGPLRVLALGRAAWASTLPKDRFRITRQDPTAPIDPLAYDIVLIDSLAPQEVHSETPARLAAAVASQRLGVFIVNGGKRGDTEQPTVVELWENTPFGPLLPVSAHTNKYVTDPPPRDVSILIDTSGSMRGSSLASAKRVAARIINLMRDQDRLQIIAFTGGADRLLPLTHMNAAGKSEAKSVIGDLGAGGGTEPEKALELLNQMTSHNCAAFFLSDGQFNRVDTKPGCMTVQFEIDENENIDWPDNGISQEQIAIGPYTDVERIKLLFFNPKKRIDKYRDSHFKPIHTATAPLRPLTPPLPLSGLAITMPRQEAELISVHPGWPPDPVLAFRDDSETSGKLSGGHVGVFTSSVPDNWADVTRGREAIARILEHLAAWTDQDRFDIAITEHGDSLDFRITVLEGGGKTTPFETTLEAVVFANNENRPLALRQIDGLPGVFAGRLSLRDLGDTSPIRAQLWIKEGGGSASGRRHIMPLSLPAADGKSVDRSTIEAATYGLNANELQRIAEISNGRYITDNDNYTAALPVSLPVRTPIDHLLIAIASILFVTTLFAGAGRP